MSRRARLWHVARESKTALAFAGPEDDDDEGGIDTGPLWSCPGCCKARAEPFHCTPCNADAEGPGHDD
jgi:hypothetical protein